MLKGWNSIAVVAMALLAASLSKDILAGQAAVGWGEERNPTNSPEQGDTGKPSKEEFIQKTQTLRMPFIANNGQMDEQVQFYAKTFGGTVFVTKEGEIVYSLPSGRDIPAGASQSSQESQESQESERGLKHGGIGVVAQGGMVVLGWQGQAVLVRAESEFAANGYTSFLRADKAHCPPDRVLTNTLLATYFPALQGSTGKIVGTRRPCPPPLAYLSRLQKNTDKQDMSMPPTATQNPQSPTKGVALKEYLVGGKANEIRGAVQSVTTVSYFKGNDPSKWKSNISTYEVVDMGEVYDGIGLRLKAYSNNVEKLFTVTPDANPEAIKVGLSGATALKVNEDGQLEAETELGPVKFTRPVAYQEIDGKRVVVAVEYKIHGAKGEEGRGAKEQGSRGGVETINSKPETENSKSEIRNSKLTYGFTVASYDKTKDLIIDPLLASTFLGGSYFDWGNSLALDTSGNVYVTGYTNSSNFPTTSGAYDTSYNGYDDVFVSKLNSGLTSLLASTYLGGSSYDYGYSLALDTSGNVYVTGKTDSTNFPTTSGAYDTSQDAGYYTGDVFVSKLNSGLTGLLASTFLGGSDDDYGWSIALETSGNVYVTGYTRSTDFPTTSGAYDTAYYGGDAFVSKLNSGLTSLLASTFLGGSDWDDGFSLTFDISGNVYVMGYTASTDFPTTSGAYNTTHNGGSDVFVSKMNSGLTSLLASTYLGGSSRDSGNSLALDTNGNVYVTGNTESTDFPTTSGSYDTSYNGDDVFVSKLNSGLTSLLASTYLGGSDWDGGYSLTLDTSGNVYVTGVTGSLNFPTTSGAYDTTYNGSSDAFVSKLNSGLTSLLASTYLGGSGRDSGNSLALSTSGNVYVTGDTESTDFPTTNGAYDTTLNGNDDVFVSKLDSNLSGVDTTPPTVISTNPGSDAVGVAVDSVIAAAFSEELDASTITTSTFYLNGGVTGTVSYNSATETATFTPYSNLSNVTTYTATITTGVKDVAGNSMAANYTWNFTTASLCKAKAIIADPKKLALRKNGNGDVTITVKGAGNCLAEGVTVTATISGSGSSLIAVTPGSQTTDANGQAVFAIDAKNKKGTASVKFKASGLSRSATAQVKVR